MSINAIQQTIQTITNYQSWVDEHANNFIVKPLAAKGIGGFEFSIKDSDRVEFRADITDYVAEDNRALQDHIAIKPMMVTLRGFIGEVVRDVQPAPPAAVGFIQNRLIEVEAFDAVYSQGAIEAQLRAIKESDDVVDAIGRTIEATQNIVTTLGLGIPGETVQERAFANLRALFGSRQIITVETPWGYFDRMAISSIVVEQDGKTRQISDIIVTLKQLSFATTVIAAIVRADRNKEKFILIQNLGKSKGNEPESLAVAPWQAQDGTAQKRALDSIFTGVE
ncbi:MAG: hypothetical protein KAV87_35710 [Desulfobacteraceae bacterium]|nr:hypothetical protein [Desulfobacteraceae bacterium]